MSGLLTIPFFFLALFLYLKIADRYNIIDKPNERSSHSKVVIRGGGIVFVLAAIIGLFTIYHLWLLLTALIIIGIISFLDDLYTLSNKLRILIHLLSVSLVFYYFNIFSSFSVYLVIAFYILVIGTINAYNFMDGINGITAAYTLVILGGLQYINIKQVNFISPGMIWLPIYACIVFMFFNFRKKALCFAGDVGSVTIALWVIILLIQLIFTTNNFIYILFLVVYGIDSIFTIIHRLILKQNIFKAHRLHLYQLLVNEKKWPHLLVALLYSTIQSLIILLIINNPTNTLKNIIISCVPLSVIYIIYKPKILQLSRR